MAPEFFTNEATLLEHSSHGGMNKCGKTVSEMSLRPAAVGIDVRTIFVDSAFGFKIAFISDKNDWN